MKDYVKKRWADLKVNVDIPLNQINLGKISVRAGYSIKNECTNSNKSSERTILIERYVYKLHVDQIEATDDFKRDVEQLPSCFDQSDDVNLAKWDAFLDRYGTHLILEALAGGSCTATVSCKSSEDSKEKMHQILGEIQVCVKKNKFWK